jgi:uncharacterized protein (DUF488 family)
MTIYTIGHSNLSMKDFLQILKSNHIDRVVDVRSSPYSKHVPHFNKKHIQKAVENAHIGYHYLGQKIGGKPRSVKYYTNGEVNYDLLSRTLKFKEGIREIVLMAREHEVVLMCSEENPYQCHRHHLIGQKMQAKGFQLIHLRKDGEKERVDYQKKLF